MTPIKSFTRLVNKILGKESTYSQQDMIVVDKALTELEELKHYPTADEVCEAIQKELDYGTVEYVEGNHEFVFSNHGEQSNITDVYGDMYKITGFCKSSTITLIGRFYEGVEKVGKEE